MDHLLCLLIFLMTGTARFSKIFAEMGLGRYEEWKPGRKLKILLVGYNGARNTGSDVRVAAIAKQIRELWGKDRVQITVMTLDAESLSGYFDKDVELLEFSSLFPFALYRACCTHHAAILCEGSTLKSTFANALTLFMGEAAGIMKSQKKPCLAYGSEIGQMEPFLTKAVQRLCRDTWFIARTEQSFQALKKLGLEGHTGTDAAWSYEGAAPSEEIRRQLREQGWDGLKPLLGIAVINPFCWPVRASLVKWVRGHLTKDLSGQYDHWYFFSDSPARRAAYRRYIRETARGVNAFLKKNDYYPVLIGMERLDAKACRALRSQLHSESAIFLSGDYPASVMTGVLRQLSALVTSRYHAALLSMEKGSENGMENGSENGMENGMENGIENGMENSIENGCPIVAVSMDERLDSIMEELSFDRDFLLHVDDPDLGGKIEKTLSAAVSRQAQIREKIRTYTEENKKKLTGMGRFMKYYLEHYLEKKLHAEANLRELAEEGCFE